MNVRRFVILVILGLIVIGAAMSMFTVNQREQGLVLQFGAYKYSVTEPGLHFKLRRKRARRSRRCWASWGILGRAPRRRRFDAPRQLEIRTLAARARLGPIVARSDEPRGSSGSTATGRPESPRTRCMTWVTNP